MLVQYVVAYDISDPKRLRKTYNALCDYGDPLQLSVFECQLNSKDVLLLKDKLSRIIDRNADQVLFVRLGPVEGRSDKAFETLGLSFWPRDRSVTVV
jgi:CRISPR-associated protein Cas2